MGTGDDREEVPLARRGAVDHDLAAELPGLYLAFLEVDRGSGRSPRSLKRRLAALSDRFGGPQAMTFRTKPIPWAYRVFYRHIGLDPDEQPTGPEALVLERMLKGGFPSRSLLDDGLTIAMIESGVPLVAFDAAVVSGPPRIRPSGPGEELEGRPGELPAGTLMIADDERPLALLFGAMASGRGVTPATERTMLVAAGVAGVPEIAVEEALWIVAEIMTGD
ncbi:MAG TPA: phenylalanine--tRNA ligase beta subunit-related protein [Solirubrobacterales bacterium]|nr:phenylalanine--tRNA ligase beta subunit-related protein [Solirubrobacterales bacterium]